MTGSERSGAKRLLTQSEAVWRTCKAQSEAVYGSFHYYLFPFQRLELSNVRGKGLKKEAKQQRNDLFPIVNKALSSKQELGNMSIYSSQGWQSYGESTGSVPSLGAWRACGVGRQGLSQEELARIFQEKRVF